MTKVNKFIQNETKSEKENKTKKNPFTIDIWEILLFNQKEEKKNERKKFVPSKTSIVKHPFLNVNFLHEFFEYIFVAKRFNNWILYTFELDTCHMPLYTLR